MLSIDEAGWLTGGGDIISSAHFDERPEGAVPYLTVLHNITLPPGRFGTGCVEAFFTDRLNYSLAPILESLRGIRVSSHFFIRRTGEIVQFVSTEKRAWHAGVSTFEGIHRCNDFSVGIEIEGTDFDAFDERQYAALLPLLDAIGRRYSIRAVAAHSDIAPGRKTDPGPYFDWRRLYFQRHRFGSPDFPGAAAQAALGFRRF